MMTANWQNILWQHVILQLNISGHEYGNILWGQLNVFLVCLTLQIKRGILLRFEGSVMRVLGVRLI